MAWLVRGLAALLLTQTIGCPAPPPVPETYVCLVHRACAGGRPPERWLLTVPVDVAGRDRWAVARGLNHWLAVDVDLVAACPEPTDGTHDFSRPVVLCNPLHRTDSPDFLGDSPGSSGMGPGVTR
jgi:hypothetical protein